MSEDMIHTSGNKPESQPSMLNHKYNEKHKPVYIESDFIGAEVLSFDVFDTVLTRTCGAPDALYLWLGRRLAQQGLLSCTPETFARARARAEKHVWRRAGGMDARVYLIDFYREVAHWIWLEDDCAESLRDLELELEQEILRPVPFAANLISETAAAGKRIVFVSDTYFSAGFIEKQLRGHGVWHAEALCLASSDESKSKAKGKLFDVMLAKTQSQVQNVVHLGDNPHSDVLMPQTKGIKYVWLPEGRLNRYEQVLCDHMWATGGLSAAFAGASRLARLHIPATDPNERALRDVAAGVAAPILTGYVLWVLHRARERGLSRLYFLARDGQIMVEIAQLLVQRLKWPLEIIYLYASRQSTNLAATLEADDEDLAWVFRDLPGKTARYFLERFDISWDEIAAELAGIGIREDDQLSLSQCRALKGLLQSGGVRGLILERSRKRRVNVIAYFKQEGLLEEDCTGIVDFGGAGSQIRAIHRLLVHAGQPRPRLFLIGLDTLKNVRHAELLAVEGEPPWLEDTECYLYDHRRQRGIKRLRGFGTCVQMFCAADHGTVTGYRRQGDSIVPVLSTEVDQPVVDWGIEVVRQTLRQVVEHLTLDPSLVDLMGDMREPACQVVDTFWSDPKLEEALAWGTFPLEGAEAGGNKGKAIAESYSWGSVIRDLLKRKFPRLGWQHWYEGSVRLSPRSLQFALLTAERIFRRSQTSPKPVGRWTEKIIRTTLGK